MGLSSPALLPPVLVVRSVGVALGVERRKNALTMKETTLAHANST
jgi:hypothetical protein